jgi:very-short-patch-repair endonuclease
MERAARIKRARRLRAESTDVERKLWAVLRSRQLGGAKFRRQFPIDNYFADFACVEARLIVELDGGQHGDQVDYDERRTQALEAGGWKVIRFWNTDVIENLDGVASTILAELELPTA